MENGLTLVLGLIAQCLVGRMGSNNGIEPAQANMEEHLVQENRPKKEFVIVELAAQVIIQNKIISVKIQIFHFILIMKQSAVSFILFYIISQGSLKRDNLVFCSSILV